MAESLDPIVTQEIRLTDSEGVVRIVLSAKSGHASVQLMQADGRVRAALSLDDGGRPSVKLVGADATSPSATLEIDDKGAHVKLDLSGGASSYLFLNNQGGSGLVLIDRTGVRRFQSTIGTDGEAEVRRFGPDGAPAD
jgi:hypothetical protein